jgi:hypothetical protein
VVALIANPADHAASASPVAYSSEVILAYTTSRCASRINGNFADVSGEGVAGSAAYTSK